MQSPMLLKLIHRSTPLRGIGAQVAALKKFVKELDVSANVAQGHRPLF